MRTGELARRAGVNIETLRFYERQKLLRAPLRRANGYRDYSERDLETVRFIKQCQHLGFTLKEIGQLQELHRISSRSAAEGRPGTGEAEKFLRLSEARLRMIDAKVEELRAMRAELANFAKELSRTKGLSCPVARK